MEDGGSYHEMANPRNNLHAVNTHTHLINTHAPPQVRVAILREEGSNGDREMAAAAFAAGLEPWDITMSDLINGRATLDTFQVSTTSNFG